MNERTRHTRIRAAFTIALGAALAAATAAQAITCDPIHYPLADHPIYLNISTQNSPIVSSMRWDQEATFWAGIGVLAYSGSSDYDVRVYADCYGSQLASSVAGAGRTDFVIGDFNNNPTGMYAADLYCYSGGCSGPGPYAAGAWRTGSFLFVDFPPTTVDFNSGPPYSPDMVMHVYDVFLSSGSTYYFQFSSTLGSASKMLLFRNPTGGTYWAGRNSAVFETSGCVSYTAPSSGYYGIVVVNDVWSFGSYTIGVNSTPQCACADPLPARTPVAVPSSPATAYKWLEQTNQAWAAIGTRPAPGTDWDIEVSTSGSTAGCGQTLLANSAAGGSVADFVMVDLNYSSMPVTLAVHPFRYSGGGGTTVEWDRSANAVEYLAVNGPQVTQVWSGSEVLHSWDVYLRSGHEYTFQFYPSGNLKLFLFANPGSSLFATGRNGAVAQGTSTFTYTAPSTGWYGVVVAKDDDQAAYFALRVGTCDTAFPLFPGWTSYATGSDYWWLSIDPDAGHWHAVGSRCATADWDIWQYGSTSSGPWPDCYSPTGASSESAIVPDFIVGDFHVNAPGTYPFRVKQYSSGDPQTVDFAWTGPATQIEVNAPAITATPDASEVLRIYEAYLVAGWNYQIGYTQTDTRPLLVFMNPTASDYWAPRGTALLSTTGGTTFTAPTSGYYAIVIANDGEQGGSFSLRISTTAAAVVEDPRRFATQLLGARPNPGRSDLAVRYSLASAARVRLELLDVTGRRVWSADEGARDPGEWSVPIARNGTEGRIPAGLYFVHFQVDGRDVDVRRVTLLD